MSWNIGINSPWRWVVVFLVASTSILASGTVHGQHSRPLREPMVVKVIHLDHADAEELASVLRPLLTEDGRITAYPPTNTLIIRGRQSLVEQLVSVIKGAGKGVE